MDHLPPLLLSPLLLSLPPVPPPTLAFPPSSPFLPLSPALAFQTAYKRLMAKSRLYTLCTILLTSL